MPTFTAEHASGGSLRAESSVRNGRHHFVFPVGIPGDLDFRNRLYLSRRHRPMVPSPSGTPMPDQAKYAKKKFLLYSVYMRPWTLGAAWASEHVPHLRDLDRVPVGHRSADLVELLREAKVGGDVQLDDLRSHEYSWRSYIRGHVVSRHAKQIIVQFMAACCGRSKATDNEDLEEDGKDQEAGKLPDNDISLQRIHSIIDGMSKH